MVGGNDLCDPSMLALKVASNVYDLALSLSAMECCYMVFSASILPRLSYLVMYPDYLDRVNHCNVIKESGRGQTDNFVLQAEGPI